RWRWVAEKILQCAREDVVPAPVSDDHKNPPAQELQKRGAQRRTVSGKLETGMKGVAGSPVSMQMHDLLVVIIDLGRAEQPAIVVEHLSARTTTGPLQRDRQQRIKVRCEDGTGELPM